MVDHERGQKKKSFDHIGRECLGMSQMDRRRQFLVSGHVRLLCQMDQRLEKCLWNQIWMPSDAATKKA